MKPAKIVHIYGVDFSGAKLAGRNIWIAHATPGVDGRLNLESLHCLEKLAGTAERDGALGHLVSMIRATDRALWGLDFPFALPIELFSEPVQLEDQLARVAVWTDGAYSFGLWCVEQAKRLGGKIHIRRTTDTDTKTPFDCYHYRIIYQTFHGMRDVLFPLSTDLDTMIAPFHQSVRGKVRRVVVETCPSSTLKRMKLPHQNYKQPAGGKLLPKRVRVRHAILAELANHIEIPDSIRRVIMRNGGGDALDAVLAAIGTWEGWREADHDLIAAHGRYPREGMIYA